MIVIYKGYTYIFIYIFIFLVQERCTEISAALERICYIKLYQRQCLSIRKITLLVRQIYFMIYHHSLRTQNSEIRTVYSTNLTICNNAVPAYVLTNILCQETAVKEQQFRCHSSHHYQYKKPKI